MDWIRDNWKLIAAGVALAVIVVIGSMLFKKTGITGDGNTTDNTSTMNTDTASNSNNTNQGAESNNMAGAVFNGNADFSKKAINTNSADKVDIKKDESVDMGNGQIQDEMTTIE